MKVEFLEVFRGPKTSRLLMEPKFYLIFKMLYGAF